MLSNTIKERPILMSGPMVRALLAGTKTQTRRAVKHDCPEALMADPLVQASLTTYPALMVHFKVEDGKPREFFCGLRCPYGQPGDRLWVRESFYAYGFWEKRWDEKKARMAWYFIDQTELFKYAYQYDRPHTLSVGRATGALGWYKRPSIHMPRAASRLLLEITAVRCERVQSISEADAVAEGVEVVESFKNAPHYMNYLDEWAFEYTAKDSYATLWDKINGEGSFLGENPWCWVVEFKVVEGGSNA